MQTLTISKKVFSNSKISGIFIIIGFMGLITYTALSANTNFINLIILSCASITALLIFHFYILVFVDSKKLVLTKAAVKIDGVEIPWEQITKFNYHYGNSGKADTYEELITVRGIKESKIYSFEYFTRDRLISLIDNKDYEEIKNAITSVKEKSDEEVLTYKRNNSQFLSLSILSSALIIINFTGIINFLIYANYTELIVSNKYPYLVFGVVMLLLSFTSFKAFITLENYSFSEKYQQIKIRTTISLLLAIMTLFSSRFIVDGFKYRSAKAYKAIDFKVTTMDRRLYRNSQYYALLLSSNELENYIIYHEVKLACDTIIKVGYVERIQFYQTPDNQFFYIKTKPKSAECRISKSI